VAERPPSASTPPAAGASGIAGASASGIRLTSAGKATSFAVAKSGESAGQAVGRLAAELQAAQAVRAVLEGQVGAANALALEQAKRLEQLTVELAGMRKFAMTALASEAGYWPLAPDACAPMASSRSVVLPS